MIEAYLEIPDSGGGRQDGALESATAGYGFVGIKRRTRLVTENLFDNGFYPWNSKGDANEKERKERENNKVTVRRVMTRIPNTSLLRAASFYLDPPPTTSHE